MSGLPALKPAEVIRSSFELRHSLVIGHSSFVILLCVAIAGCTERSNQPLSTAPQPARPTAVLRLATTTSTRDSGLLDVLLPVFETGRNCRVDVVAVGTGAALKLGEAGDADVLLVHAREDELAFLKAGHGVRHAEFMYNNFTMLGPSDDPAHIRDAEALDAVKKIADGKQRFVSRGDDSGTHKKELALWEQAGGRPEWEDYVESGQGMGPTLMMADEMRAYVLADVATYWNFRDKIEMVPLTAASASLRNPYAVIVVNPGKHPKMNGQLADALAEFLISAEAQRLIQGYQVGGRQLFYPTRLAADR